MTAPPGHDKPKNMANAEEEELYREIPHTADLAIEVRGGSVEELFEKAGRSLYALMVDTTGIRELEEVMVEAEGETTEELLVEWLSQLLKLFNLSEFVGKRIRISRFERRGLRALVWGERFDPRRHDFYTEIKGVTFHGLSVVQEAEEWKAQVIFDV